MGLFGVSQVFVEGLHPLLGYRELIPTHRHITYLQPWTQETQLKSRQTALAELLTAKKNRLIMQLAHLEVTIAKLQSQGTALTNYAASASASSK